MTDAGIPYMVSGSFAVLVHGQPRTTHDIDVVIAPTAEQLDIFVGAAGPNQYVNREAARNALKERSLFNIIDTTTGWKVDLIIRKLRPFSIEEFERRRPVQIAGRTVFVVTPEDSILSKLEWSTKGGSDRQLRDAESVAVVQWRKLDRDYLYHWAAELQVTDQLDSVLIHAASIAEENSTSQN
ncbi:MAG: hypothetical protein AB7O26_00845 [Planctomycetaceae bacterium]